MSRFKVIHCNLQLDFKLQFFPKHLNTSPETVAQFFNTPNTDWKDLNSLSKIHTPLNKWNTALNGVLSLLETNFLHQNNSLCTAIVCLIEYHNKHWRDQLIYVLASCGYATYSHPYTIEWFFQLRWTDPTWVKLIGNQGVVCLCL